VSRREYWASNPKFSFQFESVESVEATKSPKPLKRVKDWWFRKLMSKFGVGSWLAV